MSRPQPRLAVQTTGQGSPDVLLLHSGVGDLRDWHAVVDRLTASTRCIAYDARGHGSTQYQHEDGWSPSADAVAVLDSCRAESALVIGASQGGETAMDLALAHPERVRALALIAPAISGEPDLEPEASMQLLDRELDRAEAVDDLDEVNRLEAQIWLDGPAQPEGRVAGEARELLLAMNGLALAAAEPGEPMPTDAWHRLGELAMPVLVIVGSHDLRRMHRNAQRIAAAARSARLLELPGVAHLPHLEADPGLLAEIEEFVTAHAVDHD